MNVRTGDISILSCLIFAVLATGCATPDTRRVDAWTEIRKQEIAADKAKWDIWRLSGQGRRQPHQRQAGNGVDGRQHGRKDA